MLQATVMNLSFQITVFVFFVLIPRHGIAGSYGTSIFNFLRKLYDFSLWLYQFTFPITVHKVSLFSTSLPAIVICCLLMIAILIGVRWYIIIIFICISLIISEIKHFFTCLVTIYMFFFIEEMSIQVLCPFLSQITSLIWGFVCSLY